LENIDILSETLTDRRLGHRFKRENIIASMPIAKNNARNGAQVLLGENIGKLWRISFKKESLNYSNKFDVILSKKFTR